MRERIEERMPFSWAQKVPLLDETNGKCAHCGIMLDRYTNMTVEHIIPLNKGGTNDPENLTMLCEDCNTEKSDMILPSSWYPHLSHKKHKAVGELLSRYMHETDYLSEDCLLPLDTFRIEAPVTTKKKTARGMKVIAGNVSLCC